MGETLSAGVGHDLKSAEGRDTPSTTGHRAGGFMTTAEHQAQFYAHQLIIYRPEIRFIQGERHLKSSLPFKILAGFKHFPSRPTQASPLKFIFEELCQNTLP